MLKTDHAVSHVIMKCTLTHKSPHSLFFFKQKTAYDIGTGDWSSDVCSSDLQGVLTSYFQFYSESDIMMSVIKSLNCGMFVVFLQDRKSVV